MLILIAVMLGIAALVAGYAATMYASLALAFAAVSFLLAAAAVVMLDRSRTEPRTTASGMVQPAAIPARAPSPGSEAPGRPKPVEPADATPATTSETERQPRPAGTPAAAPRPCPEIVVPEDIDAQSVAAALLTSAAAAGEAIRVVIWRADGAGEAGSVPVTFAGQPDESLLGARDAVTSSIESGTAYLHSRTVTSGGPECSTLWQYVVPISLGQVGGAATVEFAGTRPDLDLLNRTAASFRLPLAAALALEVAAEESDAARTLLQTAREVARLIDPDAVVRAGLDSAVKLTGAATGSVMLYDDSGVNLRIVAALGLPSEIVERTSVRPGDGIAGWVAISGQPLVVEDLPGRDTPARSRGIRSAASVPVADDDGVLGVLNVGSLDHPSRFTSTDLETLEAVAYQMAAALRNARAIACASDLYFDTLKALALAIEAKDPHAYGGTDRVIRYTSLLAEEVGVSPDEARALEIAAMLHDIGMSAIGEPAVRSDRPLSTVERGLIKMHPVIAAEILEQAPALREVAPIVYHHHERYDGSGYVGGLAGEAIPLGSRILAVADSFVAMTSARPYRSAMSEAEALEEIRKHAGTQFDPAVVDAFVAVHSSQASQAPGTAL